MLCLAAGSLSAVLALQAFTLAWNHSIEKVRWEEDWRIEGQALVLAEARIRGTGAGMEPPPGAVLRQGVWHYRPALPPLPRLRLSHSSFAQGYELCAAGDCQPLADHLPGSNNGLVIDLFACPP
jgi:hypothetical protein